MITGIVALSTLWWTLQALLLWRVRSALPRLEALPLVARPAWPTVSVVVPARDEGAQVRRALEAKLSDGYPALELILVDDRSTDDTGAQARAVAAADPRVTVTRVDAVPDGWLGKVHALQHGLAHARGEWLLFSDADVHLAPGVLQRLIAWAEADGIDHITALPRVTAGDAASTAAVASFFRLIGTLARLGAAQRPDSTAAVGIGAFNLFRRSSYDATPGLQWLRMEIGDDAALGVMLKRAGARQRVIVAGDAVSLEFYRSFPAMAQALEKNGATAPAPAMLAAVLVLALLELGWLAGLATLAPLDAGLALGTWALAACTQWTASRWLRLALWPALVPGAGAVLLGVALARSAALATWRGGVRWRGTFYPTAVVRAGARLGKS